MSEVNLSEIFQLGVNGMMFGFAFSVLPFLVGYIANFIMGLFRHAS